MNNSFPPFHLAFPVKNLLDTKFFYTNYLGCSVGRTSNKWIDFNFYGHQITAHLSPSSCDVINNNKESLKQIMDKLSDHTAANYFLKMQAPQTLKDYAILVTISPTEIHVINFEFAKVGDYSKTYCSEQHQQIIKHFRQ